MGMKMQFLLLFFSFHIICFHRLAIDFPRFCMFYVVTDTPADGQKDQWMDRPTDGWSNRWMDQQMDGPIDGWTNGWTMLISHTDATDASENDDFPSNFASFINALPTDQQTNQPTDRLTDQQTGIPTYRDVIAASKNFKCFMFGSCNAWELHCVQVIVCASCGVWDLW